jgi:hypothetical protein
MQSQLELRTVPKPYFLSVIRIGIPFLAVVGLVRTFAGSNVLQMLQLMPVAQIRSHGNSLRYCRFLRCKDLS